MLATLGVVILEWLIALVVLSFQATWTQPQQFSICVRQMFKNIMAWYINVYNRFFIYMCSIFGEFHRTFSISLMR
jgi:hypothetical protein